VKCQSSTGGLLNKSRSTVAEIVGIQHENDRGSNAGERYRRHGVTEIAFYRWRRKCGGLQVNEARQLKVLEEENRRLKRLVADHAPKRHVLKDLLGNDA